MCSETANLHQGVYLKQKYSGFESGFLVPE